MAVEVDQGEGMDLEYVNISISYYIIPGIYGIISCLCCTVPFPCIRNLIPGPRAIPSFSICQCATLKRWEWAWG